MSQEDQWNVLLKLKNLPYGSVHCIADNKMDQEVREIINQVLNEGCMQDTEVHDRFCKKYRNWISSTQNNTIIGLDNFIAHAFSNGTTEAFDKFYLRHSKKRLRYFKGEYMYHLAMGKNYFSEVEIIENDVIRPNDVVVFSLPFADTGNEHSLMKEVLDSCQTLNVPVLIDCCYFGVCGDVVFDFSYSCIEEIVFSLSKNFPTPPNRYAINKS